MASGEYLEDAAKFSVSQLIEPIRNVSVIRRIADVQTTLTPSQNMVEIDTVTDDMNITFDLEVGQAKRSSQYISRNSYKVGAIQGLLQYSWDELQRIQQSGKPIESRIQALATHIADHEDAFSLAVSTTGLRDGDSEPLIENGTSEAFDLTDYASLKSSVASYIATATDTFNTLKPYPLIFVYNNKFMETADGLSNSTSDRSGLEYIDAVLQRVGAPGSMSIHSPRLGCAITVSQEKPTITNEADEACALFVKSPNHYGIYASPLDPRMKTIDKDVGYKNTIVERWFAKVHKAGAILYDIDATP